MTVLEQAEAIRKAMDAAGAVLTDEKALECKAIYKQWDELVKTGATVDKGYRFLYGKDLFKTEQPKYTFVAHYVPGTAGTESLFSKVDESHAGTLEDPIPYEKNMEIFKGKYYIQYGVLYLCTRSSEQPLYHDLSALTGIYVEVVQ
jgi:hypothetical protein